MRKSGGLTLIELAIVLVVIGILLGLGAGLISVLIKRLKYNESKEIVDAGVHAIIGYAVSTGGLPTSANLTSVLRTTKDSYGKDLAYVYDDSLANVTSLCGLTSTNLTVRVCDDPSCTSSTDISNVAFILISGDGNYNNQTHGTLNVTSPTTVTVYPFGTQVDNFQVPSDNDPDRVEEYDDIVKWVALHEIQSAQGCETLTIISPNTLPQAVEDSAYAYQLKAKGGRSPYTWSGTAGSGLSVGADGLISGTVNLEPGNTGTLTSCTGTISVSATVQDSEGQTRTGNFTIPVRARDVEIITNNLPDAYEGTSYSASLTSIGGSGSYSYSIVSGSLPPGLSLSASGQITGTPPTDSGCSEDVYSFSVKVDSCTSYTRGFSITLRDPDCGGGGGGGGSCTPMTITPASGTTFNANVGSYFSQTILVAGGQAPVSNIQCDPGTPCNGLSLSCASTSAVISGTPTAPGTCSFTVSYQDSCSPPQTITASYSVVIGCPALTGFADTLSNGQVCDPYSGTITALGGASPYTWTLTSGSLPYGVNFCTANTTQTCAISGADVIDYPGTYSFNVQVQDVCGQIYSQVFQINITQGTVDPNCINNGIDVDEAVSGSLYYTDDQGTTCTRIRNSTRFYLGRTYTIFRDNNCTQQLCTLNFCQLWDVEWQNNFSNCRVTIDDLNCTLVDS